MRRPAPLVAAGLAGALIAIAGLAFLITGSDSSADNEIQGDVDCDTSVDSVDALQVLRLEAQLPVTADCIATSGDTDCDSEIDSVDSLRILRYVAQMSVLVVAGCVVIGDPLEGTPTFTPMATPTPTPTATPTPSPSPSGSGTETPTSTPGTITATPTPTASPSPGSYFLEPSGIVTSWNDVLDFALIPGSADEAVVIRQGGQLWKVSLSGGQPVAFGDLSGPVVSGGEEGLLSLAFSPDFENDHRLYVYYTAQSCLTQGADRCHHLSRLDVTGGQLDEGSEVVVLEIPVPLDAANHNGGSLRFGHDGMLYVSIGDGGGAGDPSATGQNNTDLLGSVLRLDVTGEETYAIPADNPFVGTTGADEVFAYGFRNPWRMSVDRTTGDIWLGDVGQGQWEEVDKVVSGGNYGWRCYEGFDTYNTSGCSTDPSDYVFPRTVYGHTGFPDQNQAVAGGYVYRGSAMPELAGHYIYADSYSGRIWALNTADGSDPVELMNRDEFIYSFAELANGELLVLTTDGIFRLARLP